MPKLGGLTNDELRAKTVVFKETIKLKDLPILIVKYNQLKRRTENNPDLDVNEKVELVHPAG